MSVNGTPVEDKMRRIKGECAHFSFSKCHIYTDDGASANFSTNSHETDNSVPLVHLDLQIQYLREFSKKFLMTLILLLGASGKMIHEKILKQKFS